MKLRVLILALATAILGALAWIALQNGASAPALAIPPIHADSSASEELVMLASEATTKPAVSAHLSDQRLVVPAGSPTPRSARQNADWVVQVRDRAERPIPGLRFVPRALPTGERMENSDWDLKTDAFGDLHISSAVWSELSVRSGRVVLEPIALLREPKSFLLEEKSLPARDAILHLPEIGLVGVHLLDPDGRAMDRYLSRHGVASTWVCDASLGRPPFDPGNSIVRVDTDIGELAFAETGLELEGIYRMVGPDVEASAKARGPIHPFERVELPIRVGSALPILRLRVLQSDIPHAHKEIRVHAQCHQSSGVSAGYGLNALTNRDGLLIVPLPPTDSISRMVLTLTDATHPRLQAIIALSSIPQHGWVDAGTVQLELPPVEVAGVVVDSTGKPISGATLFVRGRLRPEYELERPQQPHVLASERRFLGGPMWSIVSDANGYFELRAPSMCAELEIQANAEGRPRVKPQICMTGATDILIVIPNAGWMEGRVLLPPEIRAQDVKLLIESVRQAGSSDLDDLMHPLLEEDGSWRATGRRPGTWRITLTASRVLAPEPLVPPIEVYVTADSIARVPDIVVSGNVHVLSIDVMDSRGRPVAMASGTFRGAGSQEYNEIEVRNGRAIILTRYPTVDAWLGGSAYLSEHIPELRDGARVVLRAAQRIEVTLRNADALPPSPQELCVVLETECDPENLSLRALSRSQIAAFDRNGRAILETCSVGRLRVIAFVRSSSEPGASVEFLPEAACGPLEVHSSQIIAPIVVSIDPEAVRSAAQKLMAKR